MADEPNTTVTTTETAAPAVATETPVTPSTPPTIPTPGAAADARQAKLESTVASKLSKMDWGDGSEEPAAVEPEPKAEPKTEEAEPVEEPTETETEVEQPELKEIEEVQGDKPKEGDQPPAEVAAGPTVPDAYRRSLKAYDWTDEEINAAAEANPASFLVMAQRIHANRSAEVARWADIGRNQRAQEQKQEKPAATKYTDPATGLFKPFDAAAMVEKYGNEELVTELVAPFNEMIAQFNAVMPSVLGGVSSINQSKHETLARQVDDFFGQKELQSYAKVYGASSDSLDKDQVQNRNKVLEVADALVAGAEQQGRKLKIHDALTMAHDHVGSQFKKETVRQEIKAAVTKRGSSLTVKPSKTGSKPAGAPKSGAELESRTRQRLANVFG